MGNSHLRSTTVLSVRKSKEVVMGSDGQVTIGNTVMKHHAKKVRKIHDGKVIVGFAGASADALALFSRFEEKLKEYSGNLQRAAVELAKLWRTEKTLRHLEALLAVIDRTTSLIISGNGDIIEPDDGIIAIGSGGPYALAVARALLKFTELGAEEIVKETLRITAEVCIFTNENFTIERIN